jgi:hypothetical protein
LNPFDIENWNSIEISFANKIEERLLPSENLVSQTLQQLGVIQRQFKSMLCLKNGKLVDINVYCRSADAVAVNEFGVANEATDVRLLLNMSTIDNRKTQIQLFGSNVFK